MRDEIEAKTAAEIITTIAKDQIEDQDRRNDDGDERSEYILKA